MGWRTVITACITKVVKVNVSYLLQKTMSFHTEENEPTEPADSIKHFYLEKQDFSKTPKTEIISKYRVPIGKPESIH